MNVLPELNLNYLDIDDEFFNQNICKFNDIDELNACNIVDKNIEPPLNILCVNIRSCRKNFAQLQILLDSLVLEFKIIFMVETWLDPNIDIGFELNNYKSVSVYRNSHGGGIKVYCNDSLKIDALDEFCQVNKLFESLIISMKCSKHGTLTVGCIYRIPSTSVSDFNDKFFADFLPVLSKNNTLILGDMNVNLFNPHNINHIDEYIGNFLALGFVPLIRFPTCMHPNNPITKYSLIDQIWSNVQKPTQSSVLNYELTDHLPIHVSIPNLAENLNKKTVLVRKFTDCNAQQYISEVIDFVDNFTLNANMAYDVLFDVFITALYRLYFKCFPLKKVIKRKCSSWITKSLRLCIRKKGKLFKMYSRGQIPRAHYRNYCNVLTSTIRRAKRLYYNCLFFNCKGNQKKTWKLINELKKRNSYNAIDAIEVDGVKITDKEKIAASFNEFFVNVASNIKNTIPPSNRSYDSIITRNHIQFEFAPVTSRQLQKTVMSFKNKKCNVNEIPISIIKSIIHVIAPIISALITNCVASGVYPKSLKKARVVPIFKKGSKLSTNNYRPISVLSNFNKIFETIVHARMSYFIERNNLLSLNQYGFRKGRSTTCAILNLITCLLKSFEKKEYALAVFLDLSKAFDCVHRPILLMKLERYGFRGEFLSLLRSYLDERTQFTDVSDHKSNNLSITHGVPQGSVLGPLLFLLYVNDLNLILPTLYKLLFADDTVVLRTGIDLSIVTDQLNDDLKILSDWMNYNRLAVNVDKTKCMIFSSRKNYQMPHIIMNDVDVEIVKTFKYLGLTIDDGLTFHGHIISIKKKLAYYQGILYSIRCYLPIDAIKSIYYSFVYQQLLMHLVIWGGAAASNLNIVQVAQNKIIRTINRDDNKNTNEKYHELDFLKVPALYKMRVLLFMYNWIRNDNYHFLNSTRNEINFEHNHNTRAENEFRLPFPRLNVNKQSVVYNGIKFWNELPVNLRQIQTIGGFKKSVLTYLKLSAD